jgi:hypothetical protein
MEEIRMKRRLTSIALVLCVSLLMPVMSATAAQPAPAPGTAIPVTGTFTDSLGGTGTFTGNFNLQRFAVQNNQIVAVGTLTGTLTNSVGTVLGSILRTISMILDAAATQASCEILHLELGPLDLNLLGLVVHLDRIVLDITAQSGPGNLLGNLLCAVANLLNGGGALSTIVNLLNQILAQL